MTVSTRRQASTRIGIDTGGTFTDFARIRGNRLEVWKAPSNRRDPSVPIREGLRGRGLPGSGIEVIHGTTVATNALLERRGARTAVLTTAGLEDVLEIGRQTRPRLYQLCGTRIEPLVGRRWRIGLRERIHADGTVEVPLTRIEVERVLEKLRQQGIESIAVCFLHSYRNPAHEKLVARCSRGDLFLSLSHQISPGYREYERFSTTAANAYLSPVLKRHLLGLLPALGKASLRVMTSNGGSASVGRVGDEAVRTILSGPAGGVLGVSRLGDQVGRSGMIAFDMGGTSTDVSLLDGGVRFANESRVAGYSLRLPTIDIETVGAGGGSVARRDRGGALRVGPESAGADPGPVCYGAGTELTVTDANLFLGRLSPVDFLGGAMEIQPDRTAVQMEKFARSFSRTPREVAEGILEIANATMERAIRKVSVARGFDPKRFLLVCYGGASGLHACDLARSLQIPEILIPVHPGAFSAIGMLLSDAAKDYARTFLQDCRSLSPKRLARTFASLERQGTADLVREGFSPRRIRFLKSLDLRYAGQSFELNLPWSSGFLPRGSGCRSDGVGLPGIETAFHDLHRTRYGYTRDAQAVELVNVRLQAVGLSAKRRFPRPEGSRRRARRTLHPDGQRRIGLAGKTVRVPVFSRSRLGPGDRFDGPALVTEYSSTLLVGPGFRLQVDPYGNLHVIG